MKSHAVQVISLVDAYERRQSFAKNNAHLDFEFVEAVNGRSLDFDKIPMPDVFDPQLKYTKGAIGCALSHIGLWRRAANEESPLTIAEDDAIFRHDFGGQIVHYLKSTESDWEITVWGWNFDSIFSVNVMPNISSCVMVFNQDQLRSATDKFQLLTSTPSFLPLHKCSGTPAYTVTPRGARKLLDLCLPLKPMQVYFPLMNRWLSNYGIDIALCNIYSSVDARVAFPPLVVTKNDLSISSVQTRV